jgi:hypothetical protein
MESKIGLAHIPYSAELVYREAKPNARAQVDNIAPVQKFFSLGLLPDETKQSLLNFKALIDEQIQLTKDGKENNPFTFPQRVIQLCINRWNRMSRALQMVTRPHKVYGDNVFNHPPEADDKKRKDRDPSSSTTPVADDEDKGRNRGASATNNMEIEDDNSDTDRQNLNAGGGNPN